MHYIFSNTDHCFKIRGYSEITKLYVNLVLSKHLEIEQAYRGTRKLCNRIFFFRVCNRFQ